MNLATQTDPRLTNSQSIDLPEWLQSCLCGTSVDEDEKGQSLICKAFNFGYQLHEGQKRASGEPYIAHPVAVATLLRDLGGSPSMVAAGFLHDVIEDTEITPDQLEEEFGTEVKELVEGVTKISKFNFSTKTEREAENFRKMFLAMARDIRVIVVKLADRLHNMRTLEHLPDVKRRRIAMETRDVFSPLANRLGIWHFKWELEDLSFKYLEPDTYRSIQALVSEKRGIREQHIENAVQCLQTRLEKLNLGHLEISGRPKHLYSIYKKMMRQNKGFHEIFDISAIRVIVNSNDECYRALAIVHDCFRPIPGRFKDYIGLPKPNRYQSLHTAVIGLGGSPLEVQIRTLEMHHVAEYGIAAHWKYKESGGSQAGKWSADDEKFTWLRQLLEWQSDLNDVSDDDQEYLDNIKDDLFGTEVYVFTPTGDLVSLAKGATPIDFAYRIHTEVGNHCYGAKVNGRMVTLSTGLKNGDIVEIMTQNNAHPSLDWLNFVTSTLARNRIRQWFKRSRREENIQQGRDLLEKELGKTGFDALLKSDTMAKVVELTNYHSTDDLLAGLGYGETTLNFVVNRLRELNRSTQAPPTSSTTEPESLLTRDLQSTNFHTTKGTSSGPSDAPIAGVEGLVYNLAGCCHPLPGEAIIGVVTLSSRGISIHRQGCHNVLSIPGDRIIPVNWNVPQEDAKQQITYPVNVQIEVLDRVGILNDILSRLKDLHINVNNAQVLTKRGQPALITLGLDIEHLNQLDRIFTQVRKMTDVLNLRRLGQVEVQEAQTE